MTAVTATGAAIAEPEPERVLASMRAAIARCGLDLSGAAVLTEAASGAYVVTPVLAAMAGARRVLALARPSRYGSVDAIARGTMDLARRAGVAERVMVVADKSADVVAAADIVTNSGHLRPLDAATVEAMQASAVIPLMYEAWELRHGDVDLAACRRRAIPVAGTNECHPAVDVFAFLGAMAARLLADAGVAARGCRLVLWCDNPFAPHLAAQLARAGALVTCGERLDDVVEGPADVVLVALRPRPQPVVDAAAALSIARRWPGALVAQFWGDLDRGALVDAGVRFWPVAAPPPGHHGVLLSSLGFEPIVRLQCGGLKVGAVMAAARRARPPGIASRDDAVAAAVASGFGQALPASEAPR